MIIHGDNYVYLLLNTRNINNYKNYRNQICGFIHFKANVMVHKIRNFKEITCLLNFVLQR